MKKIFLEEAKPGDILSLNAPEIRENPYVYLIILSKNQFGLNVLRVDDGGSYNDFVKYSQYSNFPFYLYAFEKGNNFTIKIKKVS